MLKENKIYCRKPVKKPTLSPDQKARRLAFCHEHQNYDWRNIIFTDESYFETGSLRARRALGVLRRAGEAYRPQNIDRKFAQGATVMFWGAILYGKSGMYKYKLYYLLFYLYLYLNYLFITIF